MKAENFRSVLGAYGLLAGEIFTLSCHPYITRCLGFLWANLKDRIILSPITISTGYWGTYSIRIPTGRYMYVYVCNIQNRHLHMLPVEDVMICSILKLTPASMIMIIMEYHSGLSLAITIT